MLDRSAWLAKRRRRTGRFDYIGMDCYYQLRDLLTTHGRKIRQEYSLVIVGLGIHEFVNADCSRKDGPPAHPTIQDRLNTTLSTLVEELLRPPTKDHKEAPPPQTLIKVLWRTQGYTTNQDHLQMMGGFEVMEGLNQYAREWLLRGDYHHHPPPDGVDSNTTFLGLVDWGGAVAPRSHPGTHIAGDVSAHYGLPARTLLAQMVTQQVVLAQSTLTAAAAAAFDPG